MMNDRANGGNLSMAGMFVVNPAVVPDLTAGQSA
jgi:hypothetical protein